MDMYYKQENDALLIENRKLKKQMIAKDHTITLQAQTYRTLQSRNVELNDELVWARLMVTEMFDRFPEVAATVHGELTTEEEILDDSETETELEDN